MPGKGKQGKGGKRAFKKVNKELILGVTKPAIRRLARRAGVERISNLIYGETRKLVAKYVSGVVRKALVFTEHARRKTVTVRDIVEGVKRESGKIMHGF